MWNEILPVLANLSRLLPILADLNQGNCFQHEKSVIKLSLWQMKAGEFRLINQFSYAKCSEIVLKIRGLYTMGPKESSETTAEIPTQKCLHK